MANSICFYFQVHQPFRLKENYFLDKVNQDDYFQENSEKNSNREIFEKVAQKCYLPTTNLLIEMMEKYPDFHISFALSGVFIEQCEKFGETGKQVLENFQKLAKLGRTEFLSETYYHSLAFIFSKQEFVDQVLLHRELMSKYFAQTPKIFRNTELIYRDDLAEFTRLMGFEGVLAEGWHTALPDENPNILRHAHSIELSKEDSDVAEQYLQISLKSPSSRGAKTGSVQKGEFSEKISPHMSVLTKNYKLSDDMAFRFGDASRSDKPLTAEVFAQRVKDAPGEVINLFMDFETFGEHQWEDTGIFEFLKYLPQACADLGISFKTPSQVIESHTPEEIYHAPEFISWADEDRAISAWLENDMQKSAFTELQELEKKFHALKFPKNKFSEEKIEKIKSLVDSFRKLQTSDHLYYMSTKFWADGDVHTYFSPYDSPYDAYIHFMNTINSLKARVEKI